MIPSHDDSQKPLDGKPADVSHPAKPSTSPAGRAVYYGQISSPGDATLEALCEDAAIDTVIIGHVHSFRISNGFPIVDFGSSCPDKHAEDDAYAPGLASCPELGRQVQACQANGKKVFLSIGGRRSETTEDSTVDFADAADARRAAIMLWSLFGQGDPHGPDMRPLGDAAVDGFDFGKQDTIISFLPFRNHHKIERGRGGKKKRIRKKQLQRPHPGTFSPSPFVNAERALFPSSKSKFLITDEIKIN